jgi:cytochrome c peroxidase
LFLQRSEIIIIFAALALFLSCRKEPEIVTTPSNILRLEVPQGWPEPVYDFTNNDISAQKFELGRALFYEKMLSRDNSVSCASCHQSGSAFSDPGNKLSRGIGSITGERNSPPLFNLAWHPYFMHDGGVNHIEVQPLAPIRNPDEMSEELGNLIAKLGASEKYRTLFNDAFGSAEISTERLMKSLAQFMGLIVSSNSKYDQYKRGDQNIRFSASEKKGYDLFLANCNTCHREPLFTDFGFRSNGLAPDPILNDSGRARITRLPADLYRYKTPSLRNIALTAPYMHDGSIATLRECIEHYSAIPSNPMNIDPILYQNPVRLNEAEKEDLISFLHTLTDHHLTEDKRFTNPNIRL